MVILLFLDIVIFVSIIYFVYVLIIELIKVEVFLRFRENVKVIAIFTLINIYDYYKHF